MTKKTRTKNSPKWGDATKLVRGGLDRTPYGETAEALYLNSGFVYDAPETAENRFANKDDGYVYGRYGNPTVTMFEDRLSLLEGAEACYAVSSGMAAVFGALACQLKAGDQLVASKALFGSCYQIVTSILPRFGIKTTLVDGKDLTDVKLRDFRTYLGVVLQDNFLFDGTIAENIAFARPHATREEVIAVSRIAHCDEFIQGFEKGYDTVVGERGVRLSGGQRQRVAIARAILADPRLLILDEATSSLDSESEALIQDGLRSLRQGRTTFVIAHRLSTIQSADQILVLEHGEIVERGTHEELLALNGRYRQLYDKQYRFEKDRFINPGEDFTPEPEPLVARPVRSSNAL